MSRYNGLQFGGSMRSFTSVLASVLTFWTLSASALAPGIDGAKFESLVKKTIFEGQVLQNIYGTTIYLGRVVPQDTTKPRSADYFTAVVTVRDNIVIPTRYDVVSENWSISAEGNWVIDQFIFQLTPAGDLDKALHQRVTETPEMSVIKVEQIPAPIAAPETQETLRKVMDQWFLWLEANPPKA